MLLNPVFWGTPHVGVAVLALVGLCVDLCLRRRAAQGVYLVTQLGLLLVLWAWWWGDLPLGMMWEKHILLDAFAEKAMLLALVSFVLVVIYGRGYQDSATRDTSEHYVLGLCALLGVLFLCTASNLLILYLGLEVYALPTYALIVLSRQYEGGKEASEAAMKYFVLGGIASALMLYGMSLLYALTSSLSFEAMVTVLSASNPIAVLSLLLFFFGVALKLGVVPFHFWMPDVYQGSGWPVTLFMATTAKIAALALAYRMLYDIFPVVFLPSQAICFVLAAASVWVGSLMGLVQTNLKRLLAYSTIAHMGYVMAALGLLPPHQTHLALFYVTTYLLATAALLGVFMSVRLHGRVLDTIEDLRGFGQVAPWRAALVVLALLSLAGLPPTVGFYGKLWLFQALLAEGIYWLAFLGLLAAVVALAYYLKLVSLMYFEVPEKGSCEPLNGPWADAVLAVHGVALLLLGLAPGILIGFCQLT